MEIPLGGTNQIDVLFVLDDSPAVAANTTRVAAHLDAFADVMATLPGGVPDLHVGVISTDVGTAGGDGSAPHAAIGTGGQGGCAGTGKAGNLQVNGATITDTYLSDAPFETGRQRNYTGDMKIVLRQMAYVGAGGCAYTRPLEATRRALAQNPANAGFLRDKAYLVVVHIAAADDCSFGASSFLDGATTTDTSRCQMTSLVETSAFAAHLKALKADPSNVLVIEVTAGEARRLHGFAGAFPNRSTETTLGDSDPAQAFAMIAQLQKTTLGVACWSSPLADLDAVAPGLQTECTAELRATETLAMARCAPGSSTPCYQIVEAEQACLESGLSVKVEHVEGYRGPGATAVIECLVEASP